MAAGRAALYMPKLEIMESWNGTVLRQFEGRACVFRYERIANNASITWWSNWKGDMENRVLAPHVVFSWQRVGHALTTGVYEMSELSKSQRTYAAALPYLKLRQCVLDRISDYQVNWEELSLNGIGEQQIEATDERHNAASRDET